MVMVVVVAAAALRWLSSSPPSHLEPCLRCWSLQPACWFSPPSHRVCMTLDIYHPHAKSRSSRAYLSVVQLIPDFLPPTVGRIIQSTTIMNIIGDNRQVALSYSCTHFVNASLSFSLYLLLQKKHLNNSGISN
uniref:Secreted protein n=1 Tax=Trichobilharzia regenti TaxID=157069 RepID=A0AA85J974_TRIRE|nr:unnamed protein product [Trichobilharzia regenti]